MITEKKYTGWKFNGGHVEANKETNCLQIFFDEKPEEPIRNHLFKVHAFHWTPSTGAWQRELTDNAIWSVKHYAALAPIKE